MAGTCFVAVVVLVTAAAFDLRAVFGFAISQLGRDEDQAGVHACEAGAKLAAGNRRSQLSDRRLGRAGSQAVGLGPTLVGTAPGTGRLSAPSAGSSRRRFSVSRQLIQTGEKTAQTSDNVIRMKR